MGKMFLETTKDAYADIAFCVVQTLKLKGSGLLERDIASAADWVKQHESAKPKTIPVGCVNLLSASGDEIVLAHWNNTPIAFNGYHDWTLAKAERTVDESKGLQINCLLRRVSAVGEVQFTDTVTVTVDYR
jgi:hypothetical protein